MANRKRGDNANNKKMLTLAHRYLTGDITCMEFCSRHGLVYGAFQYWLKKYRRVDKEKKKERFLPMRISATLPGAGDEPEVEIIYTDGIRLRIRGIRNIEFIKPLLPSLITR